MKIYISIIIVLIATGILLSGNKFVNKWNISLSDNTYIDYQIKYQILLLLTAFVVLSPLKDVITPTTVFLISAVLFGIPHFGGMPSGVIGVVMAGVLGFVLAKSVYETNGIFWAWLIHFLQDVVIIGSIYLMKTANN